MSLSDPEGKNITKLSSSAEVPKDLDLFLEYCDRSEVFHWSADLRKLLFYSCPLGLIAQNNKNKGSYEKSENRRKAVCCICISFNVNGLLTTRVVEGRYLRTLEGSGSG